MPPMFDRTREQKLARRVFAELYGGEDYWAKLSRISGNLHNRIIASHHPHRHESTYVLGLATQNLDVVCKTMSMMEVVK